MTIEERLRAQGLELPPPPTPKGAYVPVVLHGGTAWVSGMLPLRRGVLLAKGLVGSEVSVEQAREAAREAGLHALSALRATLGSLDRIERVLRVAVYVASAPGFTSQPDVANGVSELLIELLGDPGRHARVALGAARLPMDAPVEVEMAVAVRP